LENRKHKTTLWREKKKMAGAGGPSQKEEESSSGGEEKGGSSGGEEEESSCSESLFCSDVDEEVERYMFISDPECHSAPTGGSGSDEVESSNEDEESEDEYADHEEEESEDDDDDDDDDDDESRISPSPLTQITEPPVLCGYPDTAPAVAAASPASPPSPAAPPEPRPAHASPPDSRPAHASTSETLVEADRLLEEAEQDAVNIRRAGRLKFKEYEIRQTRIHVLTQKKFDDAIRTVLEKEDDDRVRELARLSLEKQRVIATLKFKRDLAFERTRLSTLYGSLAASKMRDAEARFSTLLSDSDEDSRSRSRPSSDPDYGSSSSSSCSTCSSSSSSSSSDRGDARAYRLQTPHRRLRRRRAARQRSRIDDTDPRYLDISSDDPHSTRHKPREQAP
jgi:hypothetical protein